MRILYIDDNPLDRRVVASLAGRHGIDFDVAADGQTGLAMLASRSYDALLIDIVMPVVSGLEVIRSVRAGETQGRPIAIVAITAAGIAEISDDCIAAGANRVLAKPTMFDAILEALAQAVAVEERLGK